MEGAGIGAREEEVREGGKGGEERGAKRTWPTWVGCMEIRSWRKGSEAPGLENFGGRGGEKSREAADSGLVCALAC